MENYGLTCSYDPGDNKLRLYSTTRLDKETYAQVRAAGFIYAPQQKLFVAPCWTPERADLLIELCGEIEDEDKSLVERAEERAERFEDYSEKRAEDANRARDYVSSIADGIPFGQPILVGHHSEKHARKDAEKIENGMRKAVKMWETSKYWIARAHGALYHAKYKERPDVRARRIKGLEADKRKHEREKEQAEHCLKIWNKEGLTLEQAILFAGYSQAGHLQLPRKEGDKKDFNQNPSAYDALSNSYPNLYAPRTLQEVIEAANVTYPRSIAHSQRWIEHISNRLLYEKAMLEEAGASALIAPKARPTQPPLLNYRQASFRVSKLYHRGEFEELPQLEMTKEAYTKIYSDHRGTQTIENSHRVRSAMVRLRDYPQFRTQADNDHAKSHGENCVRIYQTVAVFLTDSKEHTKPDAKPKPESIIELRQPLTQYQHTPPERTQFDDIKDSLRTGVKVVSTPQLFPTPPDLAKRLCDEAGILSGCRVLEPSAGTGNILKAILNNAVGADCVRIVAVEINHALVEQLEYTRNMTLYANEDNYKIIEGDFLECNGDLGKFDRVVMNPPFAEGQDVAHVRHAFNFLKPGGRLVSIMGAGVTFKSDKKTTEFREWLDEIGGTIEALPPDSFKESGTSVQSVVVIIERGNYE